MPESRRPHHRAAPRRRLRRQVRVPLRGACRGAGAGRPAAGAARVLPPRGVRRPRPSPRGHGDRARDRGAQGRHASSPARRGSCSTTAPTAADAPFFPQLAAMMAAGPYRIPNVFVDASLAYTNQHAVGLGARPHRAAGRAGRSSSTWTRSPGGWAWTRSSSAAGTSSTSGDEGPTGQVFDDDRRCARRLEQAVELIGYGKDAARGRGDRRGMRLVALVRDASGAYVKMNGDGSGTIITGAQECGTGAVMALPLLAAEVLGMRPEDFSIALPGHRRRRRATAGASGSQTTFNNGRAVVRRGRRRARAAARPGRGAARGQPRRPRAGRRRRAR